MAKKKKDPVMEKEMPEGAAPEGEEEEEESTESKIQDADAEEEGDEGEDSEEGDDEAEKGCAMKKSDVELTGEDLQKSLDRLADMAKEEDTVSRKEELLAKAAEGTLEKSERDELFDALGGVESVATEDTVVSDNIVKSLDANEELEKTFEVSDYLREQHTELVKSLRNVGDEIVKSDNRRMEFDLVMAKAVHDIGTMVKSLSETMDAVMDKPARAPKSQGVEGKTEYMEKSFAGKTAVEGETLSKSLVLDAMDALMEKSMAEGRDGRAECGEDITLAVSKYEQTNMISKPMLAEVKAIRKERSAR